MCGVGGGGQTHDRVGGVAVVRRVGLVRDDVDYTVPCSVLASELVSDVGTDAHEDHCQVARAELGRVEASENSKSTAVVDILAQLTKSGAQGGQREVLAGDLGGVQTQLCQAGTS